MNALVLARLVQVEIVVNVLVKIAVVLIVTAKTISSRKYL
jgi:hypothetical protein